MGGVQCVHVVTLLRLPQQYNCILDSSKVVFLCVEVQLACKKRVPQMTRRPLGMLYGEWCFSGVDMPVQPTTSETTHLPMSSPPTTHPPTIPTHTPWHVVVSHVLAAVPKTC